MPHRWPLCSSWMANQASRCPDSLSSWDLDRTSVPHATARLHQSRPAPPCLPPLARSLRPLSKPPSLVF
jgi:hypothetical protein